MTPLVFVFPRPLSQAELAELRARFTGMADLPAFYAKAWVPDDRSLWASWTLVDCGCEPEIEHCVRCDGRRLMLAVMRAVSEPECADCERRCAEVTGG